MSKISIIIAEDQSLIRDGLAAILNMEDKYEVVARASDGLSVIELVKTHRPQLILMDIHMPLLNGLEATKLIISEFPDTKILILTTFEDEQYMLDALRAGAAGFIIKGVHTDSVLAAIEECLSGRFSFPISIQSSLIKMLQQTDLHSQTTVLQSTNINSAVQQLEQQHFEAWNDMTVQERKIVQKLKQGKSNQTIANELFLSTGTIKNYLYSIYKKMNVSSRSEAIALLHKYDI